MLDSPRFRTAFATLTLFTVLAGDAWRYSISWYGFGAVAVMIVAISVVLLVRGRDRWSVGRLPLPLSAFLVLATASIAWSHYPGATAIGLVATWMTVVAGVALAVLYSWRELLRALGLALRIILGASLVFELVVGILVRQPVLPFWVSYPEGELPKLLYWSRNVLFEGGKIQGIVGNSSLLAMLALLGVIVFGIQLAIRGQASAGVSRPGDGRLGDLLWLLVAVACIGLTRSATIYVALVALAAVLVAVLLLRRARTPRARAGVYAGIAVTLGLGVALIALYGPRLLGILGKSSDLTGRLGIWDAVIGLAQQRPVAGWGWVSHWVPWVDPFNDLVVRAGVLQLHAHNAWLDVWMQLGILGLVVFGLLVFTAFVRSWLLATDRPQNAPDDRQRFTALPLLPLLLLVALLVQSVAESRLLVEYGLLILTVVAVKTKRRELT